MSWGGCDLSVLLACRIRINGIAIASSLQMPLAHQSATLCGTPRHSKIPTALTTNYDQTVPSYRCGHTLRTTCHVPRLSKGALCSQPYRVLALQADRRIPSMLAAAEDMPRFQTSSIRLLPPSRACVVHSSPCHSNPLNPVYTRASPSAIPLTLKLRRTARPEISRHRDLITCTRTPFLLPPYSLPEPPSRERKPTSAAE